MYASRTEEELYNGIKILIDKTYAYLFSIDTEKNLITKEAVDYINKNFKTDISLNEIASYISLSACYFSVMFKKHSGMGFSNYLMYVRMEEAKKLLKNTDIKINSITLQVGYRDSTYFYKNFKSNVDCTPSEYRNNKQSGD